MKHAIYYAFTSKMSSNNTIQTLVTLLTDASKAYYNGGTPIMDDDTYDSLLESLKARDPKHPFLSSVGALVTGTSHPLPVVMPSLDKIKPSEARLVHSFPTRRSSDERKSVV